LETPLIFSFTIHPICLPKMANMDIDSLKNVPATISGYGSRSGKGTSNIHFAPLTIMGQQECQEKHYDELETSDDQNDQDLWSEVQSILDYEKRISRELICTKATLEELGTCRGDSGGPLIIEDNNRHIQVGIVYGSLDECSDKKFPSLYARLYDYDVLNFIRNVTFGDEIVEPVEVKATRKSEDEFFTCTGGSKILKKYLCDGYKDCRDNSDEQNCPAATTTATASTTTATTTTATTSTTTTTTATTTTATTTPALAPAPSTAPILTPTQTAPTTNISSGGNTDCGVHGVHGVRSARSSECTECTGEIELYPNFIDENGRKPKPFKKIRKKKDRYSREAEWKILRNARRENLKTKTATITDGNCCWTITGSRDEEIILNHRNPVAQLDFYVKKVKSHKCSRF